MNDDQIACIPVIEENCFVNKKGIKMQKFTKAEVEELVEALIMVLTTDKNNVAFVKK